MLEITRKEIIYWALFAGLVLSWLPLCWVLSLLGVSWLSVSLVIFLLLAPGLATLTSVALVSAGGAVPGKVHLLNEAAEFFSQFGVTINRFLSLVPGNPFGFGETSHMTLLAALLAEREEFKESEALLVEIIGKIESDFGVDAPALVFRLGLLARVQRGLGKFDESIESIERLEHLAEKHGEAVALSAATSLIGLSTTYSKRGQIKRAEEIGQRAINILMSMEPSKGNDALIAIGINNLACVYDDMCNYEKAAELYQRALKLKAETLKPGDPSLGYAYCNLAFARINQERFSEALEHSQKALAILEAAGQKDRHIWACTLENLGQAYRGLGDLKKARENLDQAVALKEKLLASNDPSLASSYVELARLEMDEGSLERSRTDFERALAIFEPLMGENHPKVLAALKDCETLLARIDDRAALESIRARIGAIEAALSEGES
ncbi:MAG: tetratricopeptide repeat protein [Candidatus Obscuribacterales bacterium]